MTIPEPFPVEYAALGNTVARFKHLLSGPMAAAVVGSVLARSMGSGDYL